jgi:hypothetical protein
MENRMQNSFRCFTLCASAVLSGGLLSAATLSVTNPSEDDWKEAPVVAAVKNAGDFKSVEADGKKIGIQADDTDGDGKADEVIFLAALKPHETKKFRLSADAPEKPLEKRAHAGMFLKSDKMKGMEGPGWESDLVAYRIYWDKRNATDVFNKTAPIMSLDAFASKEVDYHFLTKWGVDTLHVGPALGIGGFGILDDKKVAKVSEAKRDFKLVSDGPVRAVCDFIYSDWTTTSGRKLSLTARELIYAGQTWGECQLTVKPEDGKEMPNLVGGIVRHEGAQIIKYQKLGIAGTFGNQSLGDNQSKNGGNLGLGVTANPDSIAAVQMDPVNLYLVLSPKDGKATFRYVTNWFKQPDAVKSADEFKDYMARVQRLQPQVRVEE